MLVYYDYYNIDILEFVLKYESSTCLWPIILFQDFSTFTNVLNNFLKNVETQY